MELRAKQVYFEQILEHKDLDDVQFESKNFTIFRPVDEILNEEFGHQSAFENFQPTAVRQMEGELQSQANGIINKAVERIQQLRNYEDQLLQKHGLP